MARLLAAVLAVLGLLPVANWIVGGHSAPWYTDRLDGWLSGGAIAVGVAVIASIALRRWPHLWRGGAWQRLALRWKNGGRSADAAIALSVLLICALVSQFVLSARPLLIDEIIQVYQARIFASGRLWLDAPLHPEFTSAQHLLDWGGKVFGQFPAGGPALLALGTIVSAEWLVGPVATALASFIFARLLRRIEPRDGTALAALLLFSLAPFVLFLGASMMNHITTTAALLAGALALSHATDDSGSRPLAAFACGLALGVAASIRPLDAVAFAIPSAGWLAWRARGGMPHLLALIASGVGVAIPVAALLAVNNAQTGDPFTFGYIAMWGATHEIGFHQTPWGDQHTPLRGLELVNLYLLRMQTYLFESVTPALLFATAALLLVRRTSAFDRWMMVCGAGLMGAYFAYWHDGFYLGPRFLLPMVPLLVLWTARLPAELANRQVDERWSRGVLMTGVLSLVLGAAMLLPIRAAQYRNGMLSLKIDVEAVAEAAGVSNAIVLVRESWGAQVVARLWAAGVSRSDAEMVFRTTDICVLDDALERAARDGADANTLLKRLAPSRADSSQLVAMRYSADTFPRLLRGRTLRGRCLRRVVEDRAGFALFPPLLLARNNENLYLRDLHARDSLVIPAGNRRPIWLLLKTQVPGEPLRFLPVDRDSMYREWRSGEP
ncbi:MAG: hypothetical protein ABIR59_09215 [Gemmatimonadales bacterium]